MYFCVGNTNLVPPWGGTEVLLSTNPIAIAVSGPRGIRNGHVGHGHDEHRVRQNPAQGAARRAHAGRMDDRPARKTADRSEARERGISCSYRRTERIRIGADDWLNGRNIERRRFWPGRGRLHRRLENAKQHGAIHHCCGYRGVRGRAIFQGASGRSLGGHEIVSDAARVSTKCGCPGNVRRDFTASGWPTAFHSATRNAKFWMNSPTAWARQRLQLTEEWRE